MCEHCGNINVTVNQITPDEESQCEWASETEERCEKPSAFSIFDWYVEQHFCDFHMAHWKSMLEGGLADIYLSAGLQESEQFRSISKEAACDYIPLPQPGKGLEHCGKKATHAMFTLSKFDYCSEHAAEIAHGSSQ